MEFFYDLFLKIKNNYFLLLLIILLIVINDAIFISDFYILKENKIKTVESTFKNNADKNVKSEVDMFKVDIKGAVKKPGVYEVTHDMNVNDVIKQAGGLKKSATTKNINLSKKLEDEMVIVVSTKDSLNKTSSAIIKNDALITNEKKSEISINSDIESSFNELNNNLININSASLNELLTISGIGESKAEAIISYRSKNKFNSIEDIKNVSGIGESLFEKIKDKITV
jgi:competence protein ComEA